MKSLFLKIGSVLAPILLLVIFVIPCQLVLSKVDNLVLKTSIFVVITLVGGATIFLTVRWISHKNRLSPPRIGSFRSLAYGILIGLGVSVTSGFSYSLVQH